jgi:hypothetical protein
LRRWVMPVIAEKWWWRAHGGRREPLAANDGGP